MTYIFHSMKWMDFNYTVKEFWQMSITMQAQNIELSIPSASSHLSPFSPYVSHQRPPGMISMTLGYFCLFWKVINGITEHVLLWVASCTQQNAFTNPSTLLCVPVVCPFFTAQYYFIVWIYQKFSLPICRHLNCF